MLKKQIAIIGCCFIAAFSFGSCVTVTDDYESLEDISLDMEIAPDGLSVPLGSLAKIRLDSLIKITEDGLFQLMDDGAFGIVFDDVIQETMVSIDPLTISIPSPSLPSKTANFGEFPIEVSIDYMLESDINIDSSIKVDQTVDASLKEIGQVDLTEPSMLSLKFQFSNLPANADAILDNFQIQFPSFLQLSDAGSDPDIVLSGSTVTISKTLSDTEKTQGVEVALQANALVFSPSLAVTSDHKLKIEEPISVSGKVKLDCNGVLSTELNGISVTPSLTVAPMTVRSVQGKFDPQISPVRESMSFSLDSDMDFLKDDGNVFSLNNPTLVLELNSTLTVPMNLDLSVSSKGKDGHYIGQNITPDAGTVTIPACPEDKLSKKTVLVLSTRGGAPAGDTVYVEISDLPTLLTAIPDSLEFSLIPSVDATATQTIDLQREQKVSGAYSVNVPLEFSSMHIEYSDTIKDLGKDLADIGDMISSAEIQLDGKVSSTVPLAVQLTLEPYDCNGQKITGISITPISVPKGSGKPLSFKIGIDTPGALKNLDCLVLKAICSADTPSELRGDQYLQITDLVLRIPDGISIDLSDNDK